MRIAFLMRTLEIGGTERQASLLMEELASRGHEVTAFVFYARGPFLEVLNRAGIPVVDLEKSGRWDTAAFIGRTTGALRQYSPDVLYSFLSIPNAVSALLSTVLPKTLVVWGIRGPRIGLRDGGTFRYLAERGALLLSGGADLITVNSSALIPDCLAGGCLPPFEVIYNGLPGWIDGGTGMSRDEARDHVGIPSSDTVLCHVSRLTPEKDLPTLIAAFSSFLWHSRRNDVRLVIVGGAGRYLESARDACRQAGVCEHTIFVGSQKDVRPYLAASDIFVLSSRLESFPNSLLEAAASGLFCITTDVGDAAVIVGEHGMAVPPEDPDALARAMADAVSRIDSGSWNRDAQISYIRGRFSRQALARRTEEVLKHYMELKKSGFRTFGRRLRMRLFGPLSLMEEETAR